VVAALYVDPNGVYAGLPDVDLWDEARDARLYDGPYPVVAHPPCQRWSLMGMCRGYYDGNDEGCFEAALEAVRMFGGVLEHPRHTLAWKRFGLARPMAQGWTTSLGDDGLTCEVDQRHYGHRARKPTWLYVVGVDPPALIWGEGPRGTFGTQHKRAGTIASSHHGAGTDRSGTPLAFRDVLLDMARTAVGCSPAHQQKENA
jgi:hypothetical protein